MIKKFIFVALGGALGSMLRYAISLLIKYIAVPAEIFTFSANLLGSIMIGIIITICSKDSYNLLLAVGFCGGFTTFSTFSAQSLKLFQNGHYFFAVSYILVSVIVCILGVWAGMYFSGKLR